MSLVRLILAEPKAEIRHQILLSLARQTDAVRVCVVESGQELLGAIGEQRFDCAIINAWLGDYPVWELLKEAADHLVSCPVVVVSAEASQEVAIMAFRSGAADFVPLHDAIQGPALWRTIRQVMAERNISGVERRHHERRTRYLIQAAETDPLTGLFNRRHFEHWRQQGRWERDRREKMSVLMIDVDNFKQLNDNCGHQAGDEILRMVAKQIRDHASAYDTVIRWGGEEILVLRPSASLTDSWLWAESLRGQIEGMEPACETKDYQPTVSIGLIETVGEELNDQTIDCADRAMYLAKQMGRNRVCTQMMLLVDETLAELATKPDSDSRDVAGHRLALLRRLGGQLGPTQWNDLTTHSEQVADAAGQISRLMLHGDDQSRVRTAGLLHDIGKCVLPELILAKPASLDLDERALMAQRTPLGAQLAKRLGADRHVVSAVRDHPRRFCAPGADHPAKLPMGARIVNVADALVSMTTPRPYRQPVSTAEALAELRRQRGRLYDPDVVDAAHFVHAPSRKAA